MTTWKSCKCKTKKQIEFTIYMKTIKHGKQIESHTKDTAHKICEENKSSENLTNLNFRFTFFMLLLCHYEKCE